MRLPLRSLLIGGALGITTTAAATIRQRYQQWQRQQRERLEAESQSIETPQGLVEYRLEGEGPALLLLHGSPGGYDQAIALAHFLELQDYRVVAPSRPGYLHTPLVSGKTPEAQADLYAQLLDALNIPEVVVIAISGGGPSALQFALRHPERCRGLILIAALSQSYSEEETYHALPWTQRQRKRVMDRLLASDPTLYLLLTLSKQLPPDIEYEIGNAREMLSSLALSDLRSFGYENDMEQFADLPHYPVRDIIAPTLLLHGTSDIEVPFAHSEQLARRMPHARLVTVYDADHFTVLSNEVAVPSVRRFLRKIYLQEHFSSEWTK
jgi:pimeloyl-ACP methyl ester carboxylesterase